MRFAADDRFGRANIFNPVYNLPLKIGFFHNVIIDNSDSANTCSS
jgi:hypothetical protein